jgi:hypothetical protein
MKSGRTSEKCTADGGYNDLNGKEGRHAEEDKAVLVVNGMNPNDMNGCK